MKFDYFLYGDKDGPFLVPDLRSGSERHGKDTVALDAEGTPTELTVFNTGSGCLPDERVSAWLRRWPGLVAKHSCCGGQGGSLCTYLVSRRPEATEGA